MGTLIIDRKDVELRHEGARILVYEQGERRSSIPAARLDRVIILSRARLDTGLLGMLAERGIGLAVLNPRKRDRSAMVMGLPHNDVNRRLRQYRMAQDTAFRQRFAAETVRAKIESQAASLNRARLLRPDRRRPLTLAIRSLSVLARRVTGAAPDVAVTMGLEGAASAAYFKGFTTLFPPSLEFNGRNRRPPRDPVNACLSLGYTLLHALAVMAAHRHGLDPMIGLYHEQAYGRESLASDLIEPCRTQVDEFAWRLFADRTLRPEHFRRDGDACLLDKAGREHFYARWSADSVLMEQLLDARVALLLRMLEVDVADERDDDKRGATPDADA